jgi:hypothetical protein
MTDTPTIEQSLQELAAHIVKKAQEGNVDLAASVKAFQALNQYVTGLRKQAPKDDDETEKTTRPTFDELRERVRVVSSNEENIQ